MAYTFRQVLQSYTPEKKTKDRKNSFVLYFIYRPLSFPLTLVPLRLGLSANWVTVFGILLVIVALPFLLLSDNSMCKLGGALVMFLFFVLDCVDGNIARMHGSGSKIGEFLDALAGFIFWAIVFPLIGLGATDDIVKFSELRSVIPYVGFSAAMLFLLTRLTGQRAKSILTADTGRSITQSSIFWNMIASFRGSLPILYALALILSLVDILLLIFLIYFLGAFVFVSWRSYRKLLLQS